MTGVVRSIINFQNLESGRINPAAVARQDSEALSSLKLDFRSELQVHRPMTGLYCVIKHLINPLNFYNIIIAYYM
jgi:hypothetical protein